LSGEQRKKDPNRKDQSYPKMIERCVVVARDVVDDVVDDVVGVAVDVVDDDVPYRPRRIVRIIQRGP